MGLCSVARAITALGKSGTAVRLISYFEALREEIGGGEAWVARMNEETLTTIRTELHGAAFAEEWEEGRSMTADEAVSLALRELDQDA
jgi:hypothetical protein